MNTFDYYTIISRFFTDKILTRLKENIDNIEREKNAFDKTISDMEDKTKTIKDIAIFTEDYDGK